MSRLLSASACLCYFPPSRCLSQFTGSHDVPVCVSERLLFPTTTEPWLTTNQSFWSPSRKACALIAPSSPLLFLGHLAIWPRRKSTPSYGERRKRSIISPTHAHTQTHRHRHTHSHTQALAFTPTHTYAHTDTHTDTDTQSHNLSSPSFTGAFTNMT